MSHCGICNREVSEDEKWIEIDCLICEFCSEKDFDEPNITEVE